MTPINRFKEAILAGRTQIGLWMALGDPVCAEISAGAGFDWLVIDAEHGPQHLPGVLARLQVIAAYPQCSAVVRVPSNEAGAIRQYLDLGAQTVLVPMVQNADEAAAVVRACRYPPEGTRGVGSARAAGWGRYEDYLLEANRNVCVLVQVETRGAVRNVADITRVEGVDGVFIGPADLAASMGHIGQAEHPEVVEAVAVAIERVRSHGKPAGCLAVGEAFARRLLDQDVTFLAVGIDTRLLVQETTVLARRFEALASLCLSRRDVGSHESHTGAAPWE